MRSEKETPIDQLTERFKLLVFFHLGADAQLTQEFTEKGLAVSLSHPRINSFELELDSEELVDLAANPDRLEERFLDLLVKYRRG
jgi:hypothetical protein